MPRVPWTRIGPSAHLALRSQGETTSPPRTPLKFKVKSTTARLENHESHCIEMRQKTPSSSGHPQHHPTSATHYHARALPCMIRCMPKTYVSGIRIPYAESERLRKLAYDQRTSKTAILTAALREYLDKAEAANGSIVPEEES